MRSIGFLIPVLAVSWLPAGAAQIEVDGNLVRNPIWGVQIQIPGYEPWDDLGDISGQANFVLSAESHQACHLPITMWVEQTPEGTTAEQCRMRFMGNPDAVRREPKARLIEAQASPITYTLFEIFLGKGTRTGEVQSQLYGYWVRGESCFELHVSSLSCEGFADQALPILRSVKISEDTGATLETVAVGKEGGLDPRGWRAHMAVGGLYLHGVDSKPSRDPKLHDPVRARRFYESALRLGGDDIPPTDRWNIEEGLAISWLGQDDGRNAMPHLERALQAARQSTDAGKMVPETLYNLACAHALLGDFESACSRLGELLKGLDPEERRSEIKSIRKDDQLKTLRKAECFKALESEGGK